MRACLGGRVRAAGTRRCMCVCVCVDVVCVVFTHTYVGRLHPPRGSLRRLPGVLRQSNSSSSHPRPRPLAPLLFRRAPYIADNVTLGLPLLTAYVVFLTAASLLRAWLSNPGIIPRATKTEGEGSAPGWLCRGLYAHTHTHHILSTIELTCVMFWSRNVHLPQRQSPRMCRPDSTQRRHATSRWTSKAVRPTLSTA